MPQARIWWPLSNEEIIKHFKNDKYIIVRKLCSTGTGRIISHFEFFGVTLYSRIDIVLIHFRQKKAGGGGGKTYIISLNFETASRRLFPCGNSQCLPNGDPRNPFSNMWIALLTTRALQKDLQRHSCGNALIA